MRAASRKIVFLSLLAGCRAEVCANGAGTPCVKLPSGWKMPMLAMTTDDGMMVQNVTGVTCANETNFTCILAHARGLASEWLAAGGRHVDTANHYKTQPAIADALAASGLRRSDVFITTKCPGAIGYDGTMQCVDDNLQLLRQFGEDVGYIDLLLIHYAGKIEPKCRFTRGHAAGCDPPFRALQPMTKRDAQETWRAMEDLQALGVVRSLGMSIFTPEQIEWILENATRPIDVLQSAYLPGRHNETLRAWCDAHGIVLQSRVAMNRNPMDMPAVTAAAAAHNVTKRQAKLRWIVQSGVPTCADPLTFGQEHEDLGVFNFELSEKEMHDIASASQDVVVV